MTRYARVAVVLAASIALAPTLAGAQAPAPATPAGGANVGDAPRTSAQPDPVAPLAGVELSLTAGTVRETPQQNGLAALAAETVLLTPVDGVALADAVDAHGASVTYELGAERVRFYVEGTPAALAAVAPLVARALAAPAFVPATIAAARSELAARIADEDSDPRFVGLQILRNSYYRDGAALPTLGNADALALLTPGDARAFYGRFYLRGDAIVSAVGKTGAETDAAQRALVAALPAGRAPQAPLAAQTIPAQPKRIVTQRDVAAPFVVVGFAAPALGDRDFAPALVLRSLLTGVFASGGTTTPVLALQPVGAVYGYEVSPAQLAIWINGATIDPSVALASVQSVLTGAASKPLAPAALATYKTTARGTWRLRAVTLEERATAAAIALERGVSPGADDAVAGAIDAVTAADIERVAKRYFQRFEVALVLPRGGNG